MLNCVLNAAEGKLDIILGTDTEIICAQTWSTPAKGSIRGAEILTPALESLFNLYKCDIGDIRRFACVHGPGSFTGIRLVLGTVAAIRRVTSAQNAGLDFMQALALTAQNIIYDEQGEQLVWVLSHARKNMVHAQCFSIAENNPPRALSNAELLSCEDVVRCILNGAKNSYVLGSGLMRNFQEFNEKISAYASLLRLDAPSYEALWQLALQANYNDEDLEPLYVRPCDAVENLDSIAIKQGMEPSFAHERLGELLKQERF